MKESKAKICKSAQVVATLLFLTEAELNTFGKIHERIAKLKNQYSLLEPFLFTKKETQPFSGLLQNCFCVLRKWKYTRPYSHGKIELTEKGRKKIETKLFNNFNGKEIKELKEIAEKLKTHKKTS